MGRRIFYLNLPCKNCDFDPSENENRRRLLPTGGKECAIGSIGWAGESGASAIPLRKSSSAITLKTRGLP